MPVIGDMSDLADIHPIPHMSPISDIGDKMGNWDDGDICEIHDSPDECDEECEMDITDEWDELGFSDDPGKWDVWPYNHQK